jgi:hypothetical protein
MTNVATPAPSAAALWRAGLITAVTDGLFSSILNAFFYGSTVMRLWQGVASVLLGGGALQGGLPTALIGLLMHVAVAFAWSAIFFAIARFAAPVRRTIRSIPGILAVAAIYGPVVWLAMSLLVIPSLTQRPPAVTFRWWVQFAGHMVFVGLPIVWTIARGGNLQRGPTTPRPVGTAGPASFGEAAMRR